MTTQPLDSDALDVDRDTFMRDLLRHLSGTLEEVVGLDGAEGFVGVVGQRMGEDLDSGYRKHFGVERLSRTQVETALVDLKARIGGDFYVVEANEECFVLQNRRCPFGDRVLGRTSLCMMTSNVFGVIVAENLGYARVGLAHTIARGDSQCRIVINLATDANDDSEEGREYFPA